jgi:hypothetical protein
LAVEHRRGHGTLYAALNSGVLEPTRFRRLLASQPLPRAGEGRIVLAVDVSNWLRPDAATSPDRLFCHVHGRGANNAQIILGWPYSVVAAREEGRTSWTAILDAVRLGSADDATAVTATQLRDVVARLTTAGHWRPGKPDIPWQKSTFLQRPASFLTGHWVSRRVHRSSPNASSLDIEDHSTWSWGVLTPTAQALGVGAETRFGRVVLPEADVHLLSGSGIRREGASPGVVR